MPTYKGEIIAYDLDRLGLAPLRISHLLREQDPRARLSPVVSLFFHPRDIGTLLVAYPEGAAVFSFQQNKPVKFFLTPAQSHRLSHAIWHPTGTFLAIAYENGDLIFWDVKDGRQILTRGTAGRFRFASIAWCAKDNPENTGVLYASSDGLHFVDLGVTPVYATSSWQTISEFFQRPKQELELLSHVHIVDFVLIPASSPHFAGAHNPLIVVAILASGELLSLQFPSGRPICPTNQIPVSLTFVHPFIDKISLAYIDRTQWLGMLENRLHGPQWLKGGAESRRSMMRFARRNILLLAHADGMVRLWDAGHGDEIENGDAVQIDVGKAVNRTSDVNVATMVASSMTGEVVVGLCTGEVLIFRWTKNQNFGRSVAHDPDILHGLENISDRSESALKEGMMPLSLYRGHSRTMDVQICDVGFVAAAFHDGTVTVMDLRGPAVIYEKQVDALQKRNSHRSADFVTTMTFAVLSLEAERAYSVDFVGSIELEGAVVSLTTMKTTTGEAADASQEAVAGLRDGTVVDGVLMAATTHGMRTIRLPASKGAHKSWDGATCLQATIVRFEGHTYALVGIFSDCSTRAYSIPAFKEVGSADLTRKLDSRRLSETIITPSGEIIGWSGPSETVMLNVWGSNADLTRSLDKLYNAEAVVPPRPTISGLQWMAGTSYVSMSDMNKLVGGPDRPPSKRMMEQMRAEEQATRLASRSNTTSQAAPSQSQEGYWAYMQRQVQERTEQLGLTGDSMDRLEDNSEGFVNDINKFVKNQKKAAVKGCG